MADNEETTQAGSESSTPQARDPADSAGTGTENQQSPETGKPGAETKVETSPDIQKQLDELTTSNKELQSQFTTVSQDHARQSEMLAALEPYIDYDRMNTERAGAGGEAGSADDEEYLNAKQVKQMLTEVTKTFQNTLQAQTLRQKHPDICDNGPNEQLVGWFLKNKTLPTDKPEARIESAIKQTRDYLAGLEKKGRTAAQTEKEAAEKKTAEKAAAAAKASGLATSVATTPETTKTEDENKPVTADDYVAGRQKKRLQQQNL